MTTLRYYLAAVHAPDWLALGSHDLARVFGCGLLGIDIRVARPDLGPSPDERRLAELVHGAGLEVRCHAWVGVRAADGTSAARARHGAVLGKALGTWATMLGAQMASGNFERDVWRGPNGGANPDAVEFVDQYITAFYDENRTAWLADLGFADPSEHYRAADLDGDGDLDNELPARVVTRFARRGIMAYQGDPGVVRRKLERGRKVAGPTMALSWWSSVGRKDPRTGEVVGRASTTLRGCAERWAGIDEWVGYVGFGAASQLVQGNSEHPALVALVGEMSGRAVA